MKRTALITGASSGIGREFAVLCAEKRYNLVLVARNEGRLYAIKNELESQYGVTVHVRAADLSKADAALDVFDYTLERGLTIDILINSAGFGDTGSFAECDWQKQYEMIQVNITALTQLTRCFLKGMMERGYGKILNLSSVAAFCAGSNMSVYYASKAFVRSFSEAVAEEARGSGVSVTALCPGPTATGFQSAASMKRDAVMFRKPVNAADVAKAGFRAMEKGKALCYYGAFVKLASLGARLAPRSITRKFAKKMNC